ncbi:MULTISPECIES: N-acetylmuramoyl-L-alanine amidase [Kordiimonas]|jgi:N-acetylmuramoyl-L-alanine amidase|uniref:N-acetylmuramoyl-L-alanine amidase n=1 Tax=Kordiimonas TaxID=288021 RepID=UPI00257E288E|nr:N-acetylmuramoyl-L-alanine amidase [Kordiimonas sp. UBA4487]
MMKVIEHPSPNWNERPGGQSPDMVVIHYTGMRTGTEALERLCDPKAEVSAHYLIEEDGRIFRMVPDDKRAWHAGVSSWQGRENLNHYSIGIELVNPGHEFGYREFPGRQISSLLDLLTDLKKRHTIPVAHFIGHSDIAPDRKTDPGELFPWKLLAKNGFGLWSDADGSDTEAIARRGDTGDIVGNLNKQLGIVGYPLNHTGSFDAATESIIRAFQAHWRPETVSGCFDKGTAARLADIVSQIRINGERL